MNSTELLPGPSEFKDLPGLEYFEFEEDFIQNNMRCIPMIVRFKMDAVGIKLKLKEWSRFTQDERVQLALKPCNSTIEKRRYCEYLVELVERYMKHAATSMEVDLQPVWCELNNVPTILLEKAREFDFIMTSAHWNSLTDLQRFTLLKLCRPGHENKNFPKAMVEFGFHLDNKVSLLRYD